MKKRDFNKKKMVVSRGEYDMLRDMMTDKAFFATFTVCDKLVTMMLAEAAMAHVAFTDISPVYNNNTAKLN
jgi:hypothetical protein